MKPKKDFLSDTRRISSVLHASLQWNVNSYSLQLEDRIVFSASTNSWEFWRIFYLVVADYTILIIPWPYISTSTVEAIEVAQNAGVYIYIYIY